MHDLEALEKLVTRTRLADEQRAARCRELHAMMLAESPHLDAANFTVVHPDDLRRLFDGYDQRFLGGLCRRVLGDTPLRFRFSQRMTARGGSMAAYAVRGKPDQRHFELTVSSMLLFSAFRDDDKPMTLAGMPCRDRLEALQRIVEHETVHLLEMLLWGKSSCSAESFQSIARRLFGHTTFRHELITPRRRAHELGIRPGSRVRFRIDDVEHVGRVNRVTRRATVLVEDPDGAPYCDGRRYAKYYVPLGMLELIE
ncbi:MAG: hypothetical protein RIC55_17460 [Pirellulaceae bacterium]